MDGIVEVINAVTTSIVFPTIVMTLTKHALTIPLNALTLQRVNTAITTLAATVLIAILSIA
jgi:energy-converting hydrogenase Eha subunit A